MFVTEEVWSKVSVMHEKSDNEQLIEEILDIRWPTYDAEDQMAREKARTRLREYSFAELRRIRKRQEEDPCASF